MLSWVHFGDLHASNDDGHESLNHLKSMIGLVNRHLSDRVDFALLPGDNANNGSPEQFRRIVDEVQALKLPLHAIPGDHDYEPRNLDVPATTANYRLPLTVTARTADGRSGEDTVALPAAGHADKHFKHHPALGADAYAVEAWPEHGIVGSQLGPNKSGRHW
ncbi:metallophosphoesterase [Robbsia sp. KACC 23696]|uniref:metallophosphoesterase family protein n=1 Tax=Robbsia sp. KACC 23696 TaxID=3149231 RepID=UPI00325AAB23